MPVRLYAHPQPMFGFSLEYYGPGTSYDEFEQYLRAELATRDPGWAPRFGRVTWFDPETQDWNEMFLVTGNVPGATSTDDARRKAAEHGRRLGAGLRAAHANPGKFLPEPEVRVWRWEGAHRHRPTMRGAAVGDR